MCVYMCTCVCLTNIYWLVTLGSIEVFVYTGESNICDSFFWNLYLSGQNRQICKDINIIKSVINAIECLSWNRYYTRWFNLLISSKDGSCHFLALFTTWDYLNFLFKYLFSVSPYYTQSSMKMRTFPVLFTAIYLQGLMMFNNYFGGDWMDEFLLSLF